VTSPLLDQFRGALAAFKALPARQQEAREALDAEYGEALEAAYKERFPRRKFTRPKMLAEFLDKYEAITERFKPRAFALGEQQRADNEALKELLRTLADQTPLAPFLEEDTEERLFCSMCDSDFSTQTAASTYAKGRAGLYLLEAEAHGTTGRVERRADKDPPSRYAPTYFDVLVQSDPDGMVVELLKHKTYGLTLRDMVKACWSKALNPRVYWPMLPPGYEEQEGIGWQGQDIEPQGTP